MQKLTQVAKPQEILAPAKVNLGLRVVGRRADGYHDLSSAFSFVDWYDSLTFHPKPLTAEASDIATSNESINTSAISVRMHGPSAPTELRAEDNLVVKAYCWAQGQFGDLPTVHIDVQKNIPHGAGLGGGSSDAAAVLRWAANQCGVGPDTLTEQQITLMSQQLGADVYPLFHGTSRMWNGTGDVPGPALAQTALSNLFGQHVLIAYPGGAVSTKQVFTARSPQDFLPSPQEQAAIPIGIAAGDIAPNKLFNSLERAACELAPKIGDVLTALKQLEPSFYGMSGSGAACFAIFNTARGWPSDQAAPMRWLADYCTLHQGKLKTDAWA